MRVTRDALIAWGERFGAAARSPQVVAVSGPIGAGKTTLIQAICRGYGVTEPVTSPTFTLVHEYLAGPPHAAARVHHLDLYRLDASPPGRSHADPLAPLGWDEIVHGDSLVLVEWPERAGARLPEAHTAIRLSVVPGAADLRELISG
jgi:tRNA threonylcarbamoyladenosine biosynthesis protein TsaE